MKAMTTVFTCDSCGEIKKSLSRPTGWTELNTRSGGPTTGVDITLHLCIQCTKKAEKALNINLYRV